MSQFRQVASTALLHTHSHVRHVICQTHPLNLMVHICCKMYKYTFINMLLLSLLTPPPPQHLPIISGIAFFRSNKSFHIYKTTEKYWNTFCYSITIITPKYGLFCFFWHIYTIVLQFWAKCEKWGVFTLGFKARVYMSFVMLNFTSSARKAGKYTINAGLKKSSPKMGKLPETFSPLCSKICHFTGEHRDLEERLLTFLWKRYW